MFFFTDPQVPYIPAIKVDIVDLPDKRPAKVAPAQPVPQKKAIPPPQKKPLPQKKTQVQQKKIKMQPLKVKQSKAEKIPEKTVQQENIGQEAIKRLQSIAKIKAMMTTQDAIKGNRIMPGTDLKGLNKIDYENYTAILHQHVQTHWQLPKWLAVSSQLSTVVKIHLNPEGYIISKQLVQSSGDPRFDEIVLSAIEKAEPFPQPDDRFIDIVQEGITLNLKP